MCIRDYRHDEHCQRIEAAAAIFPDLDCEENVRDQSEAEKDIADAG
jgi:hypothetical protein